MSDSTDKLNEAVISLINKATDTASGAIDFVAGEVPDIVHQLLMWHSIKAGIYFVVFSIIASLAAWLLVVALKSDDELIGIGLSSFVVMVAFTLVAISKLMIILQIWIAPKLYLIEYAADLVK